MSSPTPSGGVTLNDDPHYDAQMALLSFPTQAPTASTADPVGNAKAEEAKTTPLFSQAVKVAAADATALGQSIVFPQYGLIGGVLPDPNRSVDPRLFINTNAPWSVFICGSQGSGKSHTLSCILENSLLPRAELGKLPKPLAALVFHYDSFSSNSRTQACEAAYLCSSGIRVRVLVSPSNIQQMKEVYAGLPGKKKPKVEPLLLKDRHLSVGRMLSLMGAGDGGNNIPLYMEVVRKILRQMAAKSNGHKNFSYQTFKQLLKGEPFTGSQQSPLTIRLEILESFLDQSLLQGSDIWDIRPGSLTIVDLSCPFVDEATACSLFDISLALFLEQDTKVGKIIALDEAHKYMDESSGAAKLTQSLLSVIRQQRHLATRVVIATQEPTVSPKLLDLCSMTIVHRFSSPKWFREISGHLAGAAYETEASQSQKLRQIFEHIVDLEIGEALLFAPSAMTEVREGRLDDGERADTLEKLGMKYLKISVRKRLTEDGGKSIMAS